MEGRWREPPGGQRQYGPLSLPRTNPLHRHCAVAWWRHSALFFFLLEEGGDASAIFVCVATFYSQIKFIGKTKKKNGLKLHFSRQLVPLSRNELLALLAR